MSAEILVGADFNGLDSSGKGDACKTAAYILLSAKHIAINGATYNPESITVVQTDFPTYTGFGGLIREMNQAHIREKVFADTTVEQELHLRKSMYAIERLMTLLVLTNIQSKTTGPVINLADRGPLDSVITHAVCFAEDKNAFLSSVQSVTDADHYYLANRPARKLLFKADVSGLGGKSGREAHDQLEQPIYQQLAAEGFSTLESNPENNIASIQTRNGETFRNRADIARDVLAALAVNIRDIPNDETITDAPIEFFSDQAAKGRLIQIGVFEFINYFIPTFELNMPHRIAQFEFERILASHFFESKNPLLEIAKSYADMRLGLYFSSPAKRSTLMPGVDFKRFFTHIETEQSAFLAKILYRYLSPTLRQDIPHEARDYGEFLLGEYTDGRLLYLVWQLEKSLGIEHGYSKLLKLLF